MFLVALLVSLCMPAMADTATKSSFSSVPTNETLLESDKEIKYKVDKSSGSEPKASSNRLYLYKNNVLNISANEGYVISEIVIGYRGSRESYTGGTADNKTVTATNGGVSASATKTQNGATFTITTDADNVTLYSTNNTQQITSIKVTYQAKPTGPINPNLSISNTTTSGSNLAASVAVDATVDLVVSGSDGAVSFTGGNSSIAEITRQNNTIKVKGVYPGEATITVKTDATSNYIAGEKVVKITVTKGNPTANLAAANNTITVGQTTQLTFTHTSDGSVSYNTSNASIATVSTAGVVTAVGGGSVTITASVPATNKYNAVSRSVTITVNKKSDNSANLTATASTLTIDQTAQLTFTTTSDGSKSYSSNKSSVATVSNTGVVTAVGEGTATITATAASTTTYNQVQKTITITVNKKTGSATLSAANNTLAVGGTTQLTLSTTTNTGASVTYSTSSDKIASVSSSGVVTAKGTGTATITANVGATSKYAATSASCTITVIAGTATIGTVYYIQNAATGLFLTYGGEWGFFAVEGRSAHPMVVNTNGDYKSLGSVAGYLGSNELWMDRPVEESKWLFESTGTGVAGSTGQFYIKNEHGVVLASQGNRYGQLSLRSQDEADSRHKWNLYTKEQLLALSASVENPVDITAIIQASSFDLADGQSLDAGPLKSVSPFSTVTNLADKKRFVGFWANYPFPYDNHNWHSMIRGGWGQPGVYNGIGIIKNTTNKVTITQSIGKLKKGTYYFSFQGFYRYLRVGSLSGESDQEMNVTVTIKYGSNSSKTFTLNRNRSIDIYDSREEEYIDNYEEAAVALRDYTSYLQNAQFTLSADYNDATITITKPSTSSGDWLGRDFYNWTCFDNFALVYYGDNVSSNTKVDFTDLYESWLEKFIDEIVARVEGFDQEAQDLFDISDVIANIGNIDNEAEYLEALEKIANEFQEAYHHHHSKPGTDVSDIIQNPDFEVKNNGNSMDENKAAPSWTGAKPKSRSGMTGGNASYYGLGTATAPITQTITVETPGLYKLTAYVGGEAGSYTYLMANHYHKGVKITNANKMEQVELYFMVGADDNKTAVIGVVGGSATEANGEYKYYAYGNASTDLRNEAPSYGKIVRADHFRLSYICDEANGYLKLALDEADAAIAKLSSDVQEAANHAISQYRTMYQTLSATGSGNGGKNASQGVFRALQSVVKTQQTENADFSYAILNNGFEMQYYPNYMEGWTMLYEPTAWANPYVNQGTEYAYVTDDFGRSHFQAFWLGRPVAQQIADIPNGEYELSVMLSSGTDGQGTVFVTAQKYQDVEGSEDQVLGAPYASVSEKFAQGTFAYYKEVKLNFEVTDNNVVIAVRGGTNEGTYVDDGYWTYKADNFRLKYCGHKLTLDETGASLVGKKKDWYTTVTMNRTFKKPQESTGKATWNSFVAPFDIPASLLTEWEVKELISSEINEDGTHISLTFDDPTDGIKAGVPYMVRNHNLTQDLKQWVFKNVQVDPMLRNKSTDHVVFKGVYESGYIPEGAYYISDNKFYLAKGDKNKIKAYRAYLLPVNEEEIASVKSMSFRIVGEGETDIEVVETENNELEVIAIYNLAGMRINELQPGINILRMSDGTTETRIVK